jgi:hypothetical protein
MGNKSKHGYLWVTFILFMVSLCGHWTLAWFAYASEQKMHSAPVQFTDYVTETARDTFENWQSEFLQLIWQVAGLAFLLSVGSPQSKEGDDRKEEKLDLILKKLDPANADRLLSDLEKRYPKS